MKIQQTILSITLCTGLVFSIAQSAGPKQAQVNKKTAEPDFFTRLIGAEELWHEKCREHAKRLKKRRASQRQSALKQPAQEKASERSSVTESPVSPSIPAPKLGSADTSTSWGIAEEERALEHWIAKQEALEKAAQARFTVPSRELIEEGRQRLLKPSAQRILLQKAQQTK